MKKTMNLLTMILSLLMLCSCFTSCDKVTNENEEQKTEQTITQAPESEKEVIIEGQKVTLAVISVKLQGKLVHLPCTVKEFIEQSNCDFGVVNRLGEFVESGGQDSIRGLVGDALVTIGVTNYMSEGQTIEDCMITEFEYASEDWKEDEIPVGFPLSRKTTIGDVQKALGSPVESNDDYVFYVKQTELGVSGYAYAFYDNFLDSCMIAFGANDGMV